MSNLQRKAEMEEKRQKLEAIRKSRATSAVARPDGAAATATTTKSERVNVDQILEELNINDLPHSASGDVRAPTMQSSVMSGVNETFITPSQSMVLGPADAAARQRRRPVRLGVTRVNEVTIAPREVITYSKEVQTFMNGATTPQDTGPVDGRMTGNKLDYYVNSVTAAFGGPGRGTSRISSPKFFAPNFEWDDEFTHGVLAYDGEDEYGIPAKFDSGDAGTDTSSLVGQDGATDGLNKKMMTNGHSSSPAKVGKFAVPPTAVPELTEEDKNRIASSQNFQSFVSRASKVLERAMTQPDICVDYTLDFSAGRRGTGAGSVAEDDIFTHVSSFAEDRFGSKNRLISVVDYSPINPELLLASYCEHGDPLLAGSNSSDAPGLVLVWNTRFVGSPPEFVFQADSQVRAACFAPFHPNLVIGATYAGQVLLWDTRLPKRTPAHRTPLSTAAHTHPIYCLNVVGTPNANNLISISTDGRMCSWTLDMLSQPQEILDLQFKQKGVNVLCCSFFRHDANNFVVGCEDGSIALGCRHGNKPGIVEVFEGHQFNVTSVDTHRSQGPVDFSNLFLSASNDWSVRLWSTRQYIDQFRESPESCTDARWSPVHPALFAVSDALGRTSLYNLNQNYEVPIGVVPVAGGKALVRRLAWSPNGLHLAAGTDIGGLHIYSINEQVANPRPNDWQNLSQTLRLMIEGAEQRVRQETQTIGGIQASNASSASLVTTPAVNSATSPPYPSSTNSPAVATAPPIASSASPQSSFA